jgi:hypothetical protein
VWTTQKRGSGRRARLAPWNALIGMSGPALPPPRRPAGDTPHAGVVTAGADVSVKSLARESAPVPRDPPVAPSFGDRAGRAADGLVTERHILLRDA